MHCDVKWLIVCCFTSSSRLFRSYIWNPFGNPRPIPWPTSNRSRYAEWYEIIVTIADEGLQILDLHWHYALHLRLLSIGKGSISCHICGVIRRTPFSTKKGCSGPIWTWNPIVIWTEWTKAANNAHIPNISVKCHAF